jgi:hypothetical protein
VEKLCGQGKYTLLIDMFVLILSNNSSENELARKICLSVSVELKQLDSGC